LLLHYGVKDITVCDSKGAIYAGRPDNVNDSTKEIAELTNKSGKSGKLAQIIVGADIFIGVSQERALRGNWAGKMAPKSIIFALANPMPEILPEDAKAAGAWVYGSGRSDFENQINDALVFPGIFRAITLHRIKRITDEMKIKAAEAIAARVEGQPTQSHIIPDSLDKDVALEVANALGKIAERDRQTKQA
jgi:malate dehydrogenase (oxaloacetate-decarboxylating)